MMEPHEDFKYPYDLETKEVADLGIAIADVMDWVTDGGRGRRAGILTRIYVLMWIIRPEYFQDATEAKMAKELGLSTSGFCKAVSSFRDRFGFFSPLCRNGEHREKCRKSALKRNP